jgi:hypothetical protein
MGGWFVAILGNLDLLDKPLVKLSRKVQIGNPFT